MLNAQQAPVFSQDDHVLFDQLVPDDHGARQADAGLDLFKCGQSNEANFSNEDRPAVEPVFCLELELILFQDGLCDRQVSAKAKTVIVDRMFQGFRDGILLTMRQLKSAVK